MFRGIRDSLQRKKSWVAIVSHTARWLSAGICQSQYPNPNFKKSFTTNGITIYCVHGTADRKSAFTPLIENLIHRLPEEIKQIKLVEFSQRGQGLSVRSFGKQLFKQVLQDREQDIILLCHSRGCIVAEIAIQLFLFTKKIKTHALKIKVHALISICGPYQGSWLARAPFSLFSNSVKDMQPDSKFLQELTDGIKQSPVRRFYYAATEDSLISPEDAAIPEHKSEIRVVDKHGHLSVLSSKGLANNIVQNLQVTCHPDAKRAKALLFSPEEEATFEEIELQELDPRDSEEKTNSDISITAKL